VGAGVGVGHGVGLAVERSLGVGAVCVFELFRLLQGEPLGMFCQEGRTARAGGQETASSPPKTTSSSGNKENG
jgi:hypothetical protein